MAGYNNYNNGNQNNEQVRYKLVERLGVLETHKSGWHREVNIVAWNGKPPKFDIRDWDPDHDRMSKGITLNENEAIRLAKILVRRLQMDEPEQQYEEDMFAEEPEAQFPGTESQSVMCSSAV